MFCPACRFLLPWSEYQEPLIILGWSYTHIDFFVCTCEIICTILFFIVRWKGLVPKYISYWFSTRICYQVQPVCGNSCATDHSLICWGTIACNMDILHSPRVNCRWTLRCIYPRPSGLLHQHGEIVLLFQQSREYPSINEDNFEGYHLKGSITVGPI